MSTIIILAVIYTVIEGDGLSRRETSSAIGWLLCVSSERPII